MASKCCYTAFHCPTPNYDKDRLTYLGFAAQYIG